MHRREPLREIPHFWQARQGELEALCNVSCMEMRSWKRREQTAPCTVAWSAMRHRRTFEGQHGTTLCNVHNVVFSTMFTSENGLVAGGIRAMLEPSPCLESVQRGKRRSASCPNLQRSSPTSRLRSRYLRWLNIGAHD